MNMWIHNLNPTLLKLGPLEVRWYGLVYVLGFLLGMWWLQRARKKGLIEMTSDEISDLLFYLILGVIIGARLFMLFWNPSYYLFQPWNLLKIWEGGMSFHGGFVGIVVACWWYCKKKGKDFWRIADLLAVPAMLALALGRLANFVNGELVGRVWDGQWCVVFPEYGNLCRHPNMIYSFFQRMAVFGWLWFLSGRRETAEKRAREATERKNVEKENIVDSHPKPSFVSKPGFIFWNLVLWEGVGRFLMDFFREDTFYLSLSLGQWFSVGMVIVALWVFKTKYKKV